MNSYFVDVRGVGLTLDGWESSREVRGVTVGAENALEAVRTVSHLFWDAVGGRWAGRYTIGTATEMLAPRVPGEVTWVRVDYRGGCISTVAGGLHADVKIPRTVREHFNWDALSRPLDD